MSTYADVDLAQARQLLDLISASVTELERQAAAAGAATATVVEELARTPLLTIASAAGQLSVLAKPPNVYVAEVCLGNTLSAALRLLIDASVPEIIRALSGASSDQGVAVTDISALCGIDSSRLSRAIRLLATHHIFRECAPLPSAPYEDRFANTATSLAIESSAPLEDILAPAGLKNLARLRAGTKAQTIVDGFDIEEWESESEESIRARWEKKFGRAHKGASLAALTALLTGQSNYNLSALRDALIPTPHPGFRTPALSAIRRRPMEDPRRALFNFARSRTHQLECAAAQVVAGEEDPGESTMYTWQALPKNQHLLHRFGCAMKALGDFTPEGAILRGFKWTALPAGSTVLDMGGGVGSASLAILRANPNIKLIVQDMAAFIAEGPKYWEAHYPEALASSRVTFQAHDFFQPQPPFLGPGAAPSAILMRLIMHNWPDAECGVILRHARALAGPETRLVIVDSVLTRACNEAEGGEGGGEGKDKVKEAPGPLLANWGSANGLAYKLDLIMLANHNARERTFAAFELLLASHGWRIDAMYSASEAWMPQLVAVPI